jgi:hypothetical protein
MVTRRYPEKKLYSSAESALESIKKCYKGCEVVYDEVAKRGVVYRFGHNNIPDHVPFSLRNKTV